MKTFSEFMIESQQVLNTISRNYGRRYRGVNVDVSHDPKTDSIRVNQLWIPPHLQGKGIGTRIMTGLGKYADKINNRITLNQDPNKGRNRDFTTRDTYIRHPNT